MRDIDKYRQDYINNQKFEDVLVKYRRKKTIDFLNQNNPKQIIELGCATESAVDDYFKNRKKNSNANNIEWIIIEPSKEFIATTKTKTSYKRTIFLNNFFEEVDLSELNISSDTSIVCAGLLHEIPLIDKFIKQLKVACNFGAKCHVSVPNSNSLHRIIGLEMNILNALTDLSDRNKSFQQNRVFSSESLRNLLINNHMRIVEEGGYFIKPFTHKQMEAIDFLDDKILDGLYRAGEKYPDLATEVFVNFTK